MIVWPKWMCTYSVIDLRHRHQQLRTHIVGGTEWYWSSHLILSNGKSTLNNEPMPILTEISWWNCIGHLKCTSFIARLSHIAQSSVLKAAVCMKMWYISCHWRSTRIFHVQMIMDKSFMASKERKGIYCRRRRRSSRESVFLFDNDYLFWW